MWVCRIFGRIVMSAEEPGPHVPAGMSSQPAGPWAVFESSRVESSRVESGVGTDGTAELAGVRGVGDGKRSWRACLGRQFARDQSGVE
jgi:hypothetical protein